MKINGTHTLLNDIQMLQNGAMEERLQCVMFDIAKIHITAERSLC